MARGAIMRIEYWDMENELDEVREGNCVRCGRWGRLDPHHRVKRRYDKKDNSVVWVCRECHEWIEANPKLARESGYNLLKHLDEYDYSRKDSRVF